MSKIKITLGLIALILCALSVVVRIADLLHGVEFGFFEWFTLAVCAYGVRGSIDFIHENLE